MAFDVSDPTQRDAHIREVRRAVHHLAVRIDTAISDPTVDLGRFMALIQEYTQQLCKLKAYHNRKGQNGRLK
jgi:hypothetical protein